MHLFHVLVNVSPFTAFWLNEKSFSVLLSKFKGISSISRLSLRLKIEFSQLSNYCFHQLLHLRLLFHQETFPFSKCLASFIVCEQSSFSNSFSTILKLPFSTILSSFGVSSECSSFLKLSFTSTANNYQFFDLISFHCKFCNKAHLDQIQFQCYFKNLHHLQRFKLISQKFVNFQMFSSLIIRLLVAASRYQMFFLSSRFSSDDIIIFIHPSKNFQNIPRVQFLWWQNYVNQKSRNELPTSIKKFIKIHVWMVWISKDSKRLSKNMSFKPVPKIVFENHVWTSSKLPNISNQPKTTKRFIKYKFEI